MDNLLKIKNLLKKDQRGLNIREISEKLDINRNSVAKLLDILTAKEEVEIRFHGRSKIYYMAKPQDYRKWFELLSRTVEELNNFPSEGDIYAFIAGTLKHITPDGTIIFINTFDQDTRTITVNAVEGLGPRQPDIEAILCQPLNGLTFLVPDRMLPEMLTGECNEIPGGLTDLTFGGLPYETCKRIESMPFFGKVYSAGISWKGRLNGAVTFILPKGAELENHDLITFFIRQVAGFLSRRDAEAALKESEQFTREIIHNTKEGVVVFDRNFNYLVWNPFMESLAGISASETLGKNGIDLFPHLREQKVDILLQRALAGETVHSSDIPYLVPQTKKSGWVSGIYSPHFNSKGEIVGVIGNIRDITERKQVEDALNESEIRYRTIFENTGTAMVIIEEDTTVGFANNEFFRLTGYSQDDIDSRRSWTEFVHKEDLNRMIEQHKLRRAGSGEALRQYEFGLLTKSGEIRNILLTVEMFPGTKKSIASLIDMTERMRAEENLQTSRLLMQSVFDAVPDLLIVIDRNYNIIYTNAKGHDLILQGDPEKSKTCYGRFKLLDEPCEICSSRPVFETGKMTEQEMINPADDRIREVRAFPITDPHGQVIYVIEYVRDITERKRAEEALRENESYLKSILHSSPVLQFVLDKNHRVVSWNRAIEEYSGIKESEILGTRNQWKAFYYTKQPVLADLIIDAADLTKFKKSSLVDGAYEFIAFFPKMKNHGVWLYFTAAPIRDNTGTVIGAVETLEDITDRYQAEEKVKRIHRNYETFFNTIDEFLFVLDEEGRILHTNETVIRRFGYTRDELIGQPVLMLHPPELRDESKRIMQELLAGTMDFCPLPVMTKDGHLITVESRVTKGEWDGKPVLFGVCKDISEIRL